MGSKKSEILAVNYQLIPIFCPIFPIFLMFLSPFLATFFSLLYKYFPSLLFFLLSASFPVFLQSIALPFIRPLSQYPFNFFLKIF
ncbi:hypothetical protein E1A91_D02G282400v1 [Gossypium mustelinum]|uniref:Uncharacterized protein n=1 Tax=Gossypium mustelinum TaxID=34275 RepID=A0A5D2W1R1_GOSMU|nr:hypothetical protein E1A91_D02G282400v1 [Gossypium mustelinum]